MGIRKFRPITPGQRHKAIGTFDDVTTSVPEKSLVFGKKSTGGRNNYGRMTVRYRGGGHKRLIRIIDFKRDKDGIPAVVKTIEYDPNRSARIALLFYADGEKRYIVAPNGLQVGTTLMSGENATPDVGNTLPLQNIPVGTVIHNIELRPGQGAKMVRSAGNFAQLTSREGRYCVIKLPSGEIRKVLSVCRATIGSVSNSDHALESSGKAGRSRWLGRRPHNRGVVMNPHDQIMSRSLKKGPYINVKLEKKVLAMNESGKKSVIKSWARASMISPDFVGHTIAVHNGNKFIPVYITENMVGHKLGKFALTRTFRGHAGNRKK